MKDNDGPRDFEALEEEFHRALHARAGLCGHCDKRTCAGRKQHSVLPSKVSIATVLAAFADARKRVEARP